MDLEKVFNAVSFGSSSDNIVNKAVETITGEAGNHLKCKKVQVKINNQDKEICELDFPTGIQLEYEILKNNLL